VRFGRQGSVLFFQWRGREQRDFGLLGILVRFVINIAALWVAQALVRGFDIEHASGLLFGAIIFGTVNAFIKPVVSFLSCGLTCATLGVFTLIINAAMLGLTAWIAGWFDLAFDVDGFIAAFLGAIVISIVSTLLSLWADEAILRPATDRVMDDW
jgi:putative membrane protein